LKHRSAIWFILSLLILLIGLLIRQGPVILIAASLALVEILTRIWERFGLTRVTYQRKLNMSRLFCGEEVQLEIEISNRKPLPLPWIEIEDEIPEQISLLTGKSSPSASPGRMEIVQLFPLMWYEKVIRRYKFACPRRGFYSLGPARIMTGDLLGLAASETKYLKSDDLIIFPKIVPLEDLGIPSAHLSGEVLTRKRVFEDPILTIGTREYHSGDSLKRIHWKSSARTGTLQTKLFEPTTTMDMGIFLDVRTTAPPMFGTIPHLTELAVIAAASVCYHSILKGFRVGLYVNEWRYQAREAISIAPSLHPDQLPRILEQLARIDPAPNESMPMAALVLREGSNLPWGSTVVVISAMPTEGLISALNHVRKAGRMVALVVVGGSELPYGKDELNIYRIPDNVSWEKLTTISLQK
jgi:uncharacterized protein (DUF58 family)